MRKICIIVSMLMMVSCNSSKQGVPAIDPADLDLAVAPSEDFYQYATGGWQKNNPLKPEFSRYGAFDVLQENNEKRINELFEGLTRLNAQKGSVEQKISDLYKMGLDSVRLNTEGAAPLRNIVNDLLAVESREALFAKFVDAAPNGTLGFFGVGVGEDMMNSTMNIMYAQQGGLLMGDREYYLDEKNADKKAAYREYLQKLFTLVGIDSERAGQMADADLRIEDAMASISWTKTELRDVARSYNPMSYADFKSAYKCIDWDAFFANAGAQSVEKINVSQPSYMQGVCKLMNTADVEDMKSYVLACVINSAAGCLSDDFSDASFEFFGRVLSGKQEQRPRWKRAMGLANGALGEAVGQMYVAKYFPERDKEHMLEIVKNIQTALSEHIDALDWMGAETKAKAQEKLAAFTVKIGYPDKWKDYSSLDIDPELSYFENARRVEAWMVRDNMSKCGKEVDKEEWFMSPQTVNAYYNPGSNEICFPAGILQPPFFNPQADDAVNYGAIGVVIGHEMTHGFDDQGRLFDKDGNMTGWWTEEDSAAFQAKAQKLVEQFNQIEILPGLYANGAMSLGENIADQGGLRVSYTAFRNSLKGKEEPALKDGFTADQRFYLAYAKVWAQNITDEEKDRRTKMDVHSLGKNRVNATLKNIASFFDAFSIAEGEMFRPEQDRVVIW